MRPPFRHPLTVRFGDIDHAGIVYYPRFLHYLHIGLEELFGTVLGKPYHRVLDDDRIGLPTVHLEIDFRRPLRFGDLIEVQVEVTEVGTTSVSWRYTVWRRGEVAAEAKLVTVALDMDSYEKTEPPAWLRRALESYRDAIREE